MMLGSQLVWVGSQLVVLSKTRQELGDTKYNIQCSEDEREKGESSSMGVCYSIVYEWEIRITVCQNQACPTWGVCVGFMPYNP